MVVFKAILCRYHVTCHNKMLSFELLINWIVFIFYFWLHVDLPSSLWSPLHPLTSSFSNLWFLRIVERSKEILLGDHLGMTDWSLVSLKGVNIKRVLTIIYLLSIRFSLGKSKEFIEVWWFKLTSNSFFLDGGLCSVMKYCQFKVDRKN